MASKFENSIIKINKDILKYNVSLKNFNTMKLDCKVKYFITPKSFIELKQVLTILRKYNMKYYLIGNGSNIIFTKKDKECIIKLNFYKSKCFDIFMASELLISKANEFYDRGYGGLEYISNIPASVGGAILMNASAYNSHFSDIIEYVYYLDENLNFKVLKREECGFEYRSSIFKNSKKIILGCKVKLVKREKEKIKEIMQTCKNKRMISQPINFPNSGSIFKNKENISAWKLVEAVSLKGYVRRGAKISDKHCNFIVNFNNAKSDDVIYLIELVKKEVKDRLNIVLEEEVIIID